MNLGTSLRSIMQFIALSICHAQKSWTISVTVGQDVSIPCGVQVEGPVDRLVWKLDHANSTEQLAYIYDGSRLCNTQEKENCDLRSDGSLMLQNVQETDNGDYFCVLDTEKYYSQHTLVVHAEVAFETCPNSEDVFVTQTGPDEIVLAYTNPVCKNTDVIGLVTCDSPSGAKIGMSVTEIVCTCTHSGNVVDTCQIPIPDVTPENRPGSDSLPSSTVAFETCPNSEDVFVTQTGHDEIVLAYTNPVCKNTDVIGLVTCDSPSGAKIGMSVTEIVCTCTHSGNVVDTCEIPIPAVGIACATVTAQGTILGIFIGAVLVAVILIVIVILKKKSSKKGEILKKKSSKNGEIDVENGHEKDKLMDETAKSKKSKSSTPQRSRKEHTKPEFTTPLQPQMTVIHGKPLELKCSVNGYPILTILWYKNGKQLDPQAGYNTTFSEGEAMLTAERTKEGDEGMFFCRAVNSAGDHITHCNVLVERSPVTMQPSDDNGTLAEVRSDVTDSGLPCTNPDESGNTDVDTPDSNNQRVTQHSIPCCTEIREFGVEDISAEFRILPSRSNPTGGISIFCNRDENLTVGFHKGDLSTLPKPTLDPFNGGMAISVADTVAVPLHINCLKCGYSCCTLEVNGGEWSKKQPQTDCKITCTEEDTDEI